MAPTSNICALFFLSATIFSQVQSSEKIDFKSIFHTPQQRKYDDFEILERSSFEPDDLPKDPTRCITEKPKAIANAQVLVNFDSHKKMKCTEPCDRLKLQQPLVYLLPQVQHHDALYHPSPVHYHTPQCMQFPGCCYPNPCAAHVMSLPYPKLPAKVSKSCIFNLKHEIETLVDPNEMYGLTMPCGSLQKSEEVIPMDLGVVEVPSPNQQELITDDEELVLVGLNKLPIEDETKIIGLKEEELILIGPAKSKECAQEIEGFQQISNAPKELISKPLEYAPEIEIPNIPTKPDEELILVGPANYEPKIEGFEQISNAPSKSDEELILVGPAKYEPKIEGFEQISNALSKDEEELISVGPAKYESKIESFEQISNAPSKSEEELILVGPARYEPKIEGFEQISHAPSKGVEEIILVSPAEPKIEGFKQLPKDNEEMIFVSPAKPNIEEFVKIPGPCGTQSKPKKTPISGEAQKRILCTIENLVNHLVYDDVNGMQPCEKLRIAEVLTQILFNLKNEAEPSAVNEESLKAFFDFIKRVQNEYSSVAKVACRTGTPIPYLPISEGTSNPATLLTQLQSRLREVKEDPEKEMTEKDEEFANEYSLLLLSYLQALQEQNDKAKPVENAATPSSPNSPIIVSPKEVTKEEIKKEILEEVELPLLNQYVVQLNTDRENEKPLSNEDVLNLWVDTTLKMPSEKKKTEEGEVQSEDVLKIPSEAKKEEAPKTKEEEVQEEINTYKHILESKPKEEEVVDHKKEKEIILAKPNTQGVPKPTEAKQESDEHSTDLALLLKYFHLLSPDVVPVEAQSSEVKPKEVNTGLLRPDVKVEAVVKDKEEYCTDEPQSDSPQSPKPADIIKVEVSDTLTSKNEEYAQKEEECIRVDEPKDLDLPLAKHQDVIEFTKLQQKQPEDFIKQQQPEDFLKQKQPEDFIKLQQPEDFIKQKQPEDFIKLKQPEDIMKVIKQDEQEDKIIRIDHHSVPLAKLKKDIDINIFKEIKEHEQGQGEIIKANAIVKETEPIHKEHEEIMKVKPKEQGEIIKVGDGVKPVDLSSMKLKKDGVEEIIKHPLFHNQPLEEIIKVEQKEDEGLQKEQEIIKANEEVTKTKLPVEDQKEFIKVSDSKSLKTKEEKTENVIKVGQNSEQPIIKVENPEGDFLNLNEHVDKFEEMGKAHQEEDVIEIGKEKKRAANEEEHIQLLAPAPKEGVHKHISKVLPTLKEYLEFLKTKQGDGSFPQSTFDKYVEFVKANQEGDSPLLEFMKTKEGGGVSLLFPFIDEYLEFVKANQASILKNLSPSEYVEFMKAKQEDGASEADLKKYLGFKDVPSLNAYLEFVKAKHASLKDLGLTEDIEFMKANEYIEFMKTKEVPKDKYLNFKSLATPSDYIEFKKAKGQEEESHGKYLKFEEVPSLDKYIEFLKEKGVQHSLDKYIEFLKKKNDHRLDEYIKFLKEKGGQHTLGKYFEFLKAPKDLNLPEYMEFMKTNPEETPQKYLNFKHLSLSAPSLNKYLEFVKSKQDLSPAEYVEFVKAPEFLTFKKLPFLDDYIEFLKTNKHLSFSLPGYLEFVKAKSPEEYLNFQRLVSSDEYIKFIMSLPESLEFMKEVTPEKYLSFKELLSPEEYVEFVKANKSVPEYVEFMKAKQVQHCKEEKYNEFMEAKPKSDNLKDLTLEDISDMCKIMDNLEYIKLKLDGLEKVKVCQCEPDLRKLETPSGYEILTPNSYQYYHSERDSTKNIFPHDIDDLSKLKKGGSPNIFDLIFPDGVKQNIVPILHPQMAPPSSSNVISLCSCGRKIENGRCPSCASYIKEFNE